MTFADAWLGLGGDMVRTLGVRQGGGRLREGAVASIRDLVKAWVGRGNILDHLHAATGKRCRRSIGRSSLDPRRRRRCGSAAPRFLAGLKRFDEAVAACDRALWRSSPNWATAAGTRLNLKLLACDWTNLQRETRASWRTWSGGRQPSNGAVYSTSHSGSAYWRRQGRAAHGDDATDR